MKRAETKSSLVANVCELRNIPVKIRPGKIANMLVYAHNRRAACRGIISAHPEDRTSRIRRGWPTMLTWIGVMKAEYCPSWEITLAPASWLRLDSDRERGPTMRTQEARPLWVGITLGLLIIGSPRTYLPASWSKMFWRS